MSDTIEVGEAMINSYTKIRKNPYSERIRKHGYTTRVYTGGEYTETHVSPEEIEETTRHAIESIDKMEADGWQGCTPVQIRAYIKYREANRA